MNRGFKKFRDIYGKIMDIASIVSQEYSDDEEDEVQIPTTFSRLIENIVLNSLLILHKENRYKISKTLPNKDKHCPICLETFEKNRNISTTDCGHSFCITCLDRWLEKKDNCPICRATLSV
jgi:hypothetical protein